MIHFTVSFVLTWFAVVVLLAWESTEDPVYDFEEPKESEND